MIRKAKREDLDAIAWIYSHIHDEEEAGDVTIGWVRGVYPERETAAAALERGDLFVQENEEGVLVGTAIINQIQVPEYALGNWRYEPNNKNICVLHTLVIDPFAKGRGYGREFVNYYEDFAKSAGCTCLRMDTNARNTNARRFYERLGYEERGSVPCVFNGIEGVELVLLEKKIQ